MRDDRRSISYARIDSTLAHREYTDRFAYRPAAGWRGLQKTAFWLLAKIGAYHGETVEVLTRTPKQNDDTAAALLDQVENSYERLHHGERLRIYVGPDRFPDLMHLADHMGMSPVSFTGRISTATGRHDLRWHDIPVTMVPWMQGAVVVPDEQPR